MKKAQGLPITVIIIAIIGLVLLVIMIAMVSQRSSLFGKGLKNASEQTCAPNEKVPIGADCDVVYGTFTDLDSSQVCCRKGTVRQ